MATQLVTLPEVERLSSSVLRILGGNPGKFTLQGTNTYLVGQGHQRILIDTGEGRPSWASHLKRVLAQENATVHQALLTHWHHDHVRGVPDLVELCPNVTIYKHEPGPGQSSIEDGQVFSVEGATLRAYHTPGHTVDHMMFVLEEEDAVFTGDNVLGHGTSVFEDLRDYVSSLQRMQNRVSGRGYPGHGAVIDNATSKISEYIKHRQQREDEVMRVLRYGQPDVVDGESSIPQERTFWTPLELVKVIYKDVPENLHLPASHGVQLVLQKLEDDGRVVHDRDLNAWSLERGKSPL
ncbi:putative metallo-beta-lactamase domain protein [Aspergillus saccharolyticus JOP 1030-1]|uniref:Putative metallo-beta-lactamase domain protein n=1 Tax=Aspergillus saccharolyticus JOP 1030-1 TaxID=1450539 RepID=A0A318ZH41_9EURO|nr:putative metallo-beta-lactamase domain protein [Aspergillus saccharolyticus JOP 1030-1]PYH46876.1 putative metallo-beta-lactamase domain protein [Aspergillus saccharolyticus JOP 1030-1]